MILRTLTERNKANQAAHFLRRNGIAFVLVLFIAIGLKHYYSVSSPDSLAWLTAPLKILIQFISGLQFTFEVGYGYMNLSHGIGIAKACIGINYMIALFCMLCFSFISLFERQRDKILFLCSGVLVAYLLTIVVNSIRILVAIALRTYHVAIPGLSYEQLHRIEGIILYFSGMCGIYLVTGFLIRKLTQRPSNSCSTSPALMYSSFHQNTLVIPLFWYAVIAIVVPLLNGALFSHPAHFLEHTAWILALSLLLFFLFALLRKGAAAEH